MFVFCFRDQLNLFPMSPLLSPSHFLVISYITKCLSQHFQVVRSKLQEQGQVRNVEKNVFRKGLMLLKGMIFGSLLNNSCNVNSFYISFFAKGLCHSLLHISLVGFFLFQIFFKLFRGIHFFPAFT